MLISDIPLVKMVGISRGGGGMLELPFSTSVQNHLSTMHASALFTLAETASGDALRRLFPDLVDNVVPVLRDSSMKFKKPASSTVIAFGTVREDAVQRFRDQFARKGRSSITVDVEVKDAEGFVTCAGTFTWFVQSMSQNEL